MPVNANGVSQPGPGIQYNFEVQYSCTPLTSRPSPLPDFQTSRRALHKIDDPAARTPVHKHIYGLSTNVHICTSLLPRPSLGCQYYIHPGSKYRLLVIRLMYANMQFAVFRFLDLRAVYPQMLPGRRVYVASAFSLVQPLYPPSCLARRSG